MNRQGAKSTSGMDAIEKWSTSLAQDPDCDLPDKSMCVPPKSQTSTAPQQQSASSAPGASDNEADESEYAGASEYVSDQTSWQPNSASVVNYFTFLMHFRQRRRKRRLE